MFSIGSMIIAHPNRYLHQSYKYEPRNGIKIKEGLDTMKYGRICLILDT